MRSLQRVGAGLCALALATAMAACGDDDDGAADATTSSTTTTAEEPTTVEVTAIDYGYEGLPASIAAGTTLTLSNSSADELHELVAIPLPDDEERTVEELLALSEAELDALFGEVEPATVLLAPPGRGEQIAAVGDGSFTEPGRYAVFCAIPTGADPDAYLNAPPSDGPPDVEGGPPHFLSGMFGEVTVE